jgi:hypothetical protein
VCFHLEVASDLEYSFWQSPWAVPVEGPPGRLISHWLPKVHCNSLTCRMRHHPPPSADRESEHLAQYPAWSQKRRHRRPQTRRGPIRNHEMITSIAARGLLASFSVGELGEAGDSFQTGNIRPTVHLKLGLPRPASLSSCARSASGHRVGWTTAVTAVTAGQHPAEVYPVCRLGLVPF